MYLNNDSNQNPELVTILKAIVAEYSKERKYLTGVELVSILHKYGYYEGEEDNSNSCIRGINQEFLTENGFNLVIFEGRFLEEDPPEMLHTCLFFHPEDAAEMEEDAQRRQNELDSDRYSDSGYYSNHRNDKRYNNEDDDEGDDDNDNEGGDYDLYGGGPTGDLTDDLIDSAFDGDPSNYWNID